MAGSTTPSDGTTGVSPKNGTPLPSTTTPSTITPTRTGIGSDYVASAQAAKNQNGDTPAVANAASTTTPVTDTSFLSNGDLPWAIVLAPTNVSGHGGVGVGGKHNLQPGDWVMGFFADGDDQQQPVIVGVIPGGVGGGNGGSGSGGSGSGGNDSVAPASTKAYANEDQVYKKLLSLGYNHTQVCGIMGNLIVESGLNAGVVNSIGATGLAQWTDSGKRRTNMINFTKARGKPYPNVEGQLEFVDHELKSSEGRALREINQPGMTAEAVAKQFCLWFERPGKSEANIPRRQAEAKRLYLKYLKSGVPTGGAATTPNG